MCGHLTTSVAKVSWPYKVVKKVGILYLEYGSLHCNKFSQLYEEGGGAARKKFSKKVDCLRVRLPRKKKIHSSRYIQADF